MYTIKKKAMKNRQDIGVMSSTNKMGFNGLMQSAKCYKGSHQQIITVILERKILFWIQHNSFIFYHGMLHLRLGFNEKCAFLFKLCQDAVCLMLLFFSSFSSQLLITMEEAFLGCFTIVSLICTLGSMHPCQELNKAAYLPPDAQEASVCVDEGAIV